MKERKRVFVLGGYGETGLRFARFVARLNDVDLVIAGRNLDAAERAVETLREENPELRGTARVVDGCDQSSVRDALKDVDLFMNAGPALPAECIETMAREVINAKSDWLDVQLSSVQGVILRSFESEIAREKLCFAIQGGFHPGMAALLARYAAAKLERVESAIIGSYLNPKGGLPFTSGVDELIEMFRSYSTKRFEEGRWVDTKGKGKGDYRTFEFPFGLGKAKCVSMALEEMDAVPEMLLGLQNTGFFIGGGDFITNWIISPLLMAGLKLFPGVSDRSWGRLYWWSLNRFSRPPHGTALQLEASGTKETKPMELHLALSHPDAYDLTAIPLAALATQMLEGCVRPLAGVHYAAHLPDPVRMLSDMVTLGVKKLEEMKECPSS